MKQHFFILSAALCLCACVSDDPRQGGFIGGVIGLSNGSYDQRIADRRASLSRLQNMQQDLQIDNAILNQKKNLQLAKVNRLKHQIGSLNADMRSLRSQIANLKSNQKIPRSTLRQQEQRINKLQHAISNQNNQLGNAGSEKEVAAIEANIRVLKKQLAVEQQRTLLLTR